MPRQTGPELDAASNAEENELLAALATQDPWELLTRLNDLPIHERVKGYDLLIPMAAMKTAAERDVLIQQMHKVMKVSTETVRKDIKAYLTSTNGTSEVAMATRVIGDDFLAEEVFDPTAKPSERYRFALFKDGEVEYVEHVELNGTTFAPIPSKLAEYGVVLFPSMAVNYKTDIRLFQDVRHFLYSYVDIPHEFLNLASYYVMLTWIYDRFSVLPYLRVLGDWGVGKSRVLEAVGSICYLPIFAAGATTPAPIFRVLDLYRGTLVFDETDFTQSEHSSDMIKILNVGYQNRFPVLRAEKDGSGGFEPKAFRVFGPKLLASRHEYKDRALESRCFTHVMSGGVEVRKDIPLLPTEEFITEALTIRNKLLRWRFDTYHKAKINPRERIEGLEARLNQIMLPMRAVMTSEPARKFLMDLIQAYQVKMKEDRGVTVEALVVAAITTLHRAHRPVTFKSLREAVKEEDENTDLTNYRLSGIVRKTLGLRMGRTAAGMIVLPDEPALDRIRRKYGL